MSETKHVVVIGGGPGGYVAAFLAADHGFKTTLVDMQTHPGGVCLHWGCIPSKALLHAAKIITEADGAAAVGIRFQKPEIDLASLRAWKNKVVESLTSGLGQQCQKRKVDFIQGRATFLASDRITIHKPSGEKMDLSYDHCILATGSIPRALPELNSGSPWVMDSTRALALEDIPGRLLVIGGGVIGLELGSVYAALGSRVTFMEMTPGLLPGADRDLVRPVVKRISAWAEKIMLETRIVQVLEGERHIEVTFADKAGNQQTDTFDRVLVSVGRLPNSAGLGLENTRVKLDRGFVTVDRSMRTADPRILAIGDVTGGPMLAHKASHEARVAVEVLAGKKAEFDPRGIPAVAFTDPELAWVGLTETEAQKQGIVVKTVRFPWAASGRAQTLSHADGSTKLIVDPETERILGVGIVGTGAGDLISEGVLALEMGATAYDLAATIHPHPTLSETIMEAADLFLGHCAHYYAPKR
ncbi:MAG TPA: dihydrolipoyl dehydrogenase [Magnetococcales bacterium]|nr:dihydrolipoyl dehydrogenase [Magnetococcales bacterium]